jgi:hydrogenase expression/formation protein HypE
MKDDTVQLGHGGGGRLSRDLVGNEIVARFGDGPLAGLPDAATLPFEADQLVFTTDSFVVQPIEFPGGNIGDLAVHGTVNDLAVCGSRPKWISVGLILEEGLPLSLLRKVLDSLKAAADTCEVVVATGDTKVVARGQCDGLYINTSGIGERLPGFELGPQRIRPGDAVIVSGPLADHGMAVLAAREGIGIQNGPISDTGPVHRLVLAIADLADGLHFMRDPTRGGAAAVLNEAVEDTALDVLLREDDIPLSPGGHAVAEILGLDPLHVASEGRVILFCAEDMAATVLSRWQDLEHGRGSTRMGQVVSGESRVVMETVTGGKRLVDVPQGELLPRIC